jgi:hypothetical protein
MLSKMMPCLSISLPPVRRVSRAKECSAEADMAKQHTRSQSLKSIAGAAAVCLGIFVLFGNLNWAAPQLGNLLCGAAGKVLGILPSAALGAWGAMQAYSFDHHRLSECLLQMLLSLLPMLFDMAGAI